MSFKLEHTDPKSSARAGVLQTAHGAIETPIFMPVGTLGSVKGVDQSFLSDQIDAPVILSNTYHLLLRPGHDIVSEAGGIHKFIGTGLC